MSRDVKRDLSEVGTKRQAAGTVPQLSGRLLLLLCIEWKPWQRGSRFRLRAAVCLKMGYPKIAMFDQENDHEPWDFDGIFEASICSNKPMRSLFLHVHSHLRRLWDAPLLKLLGIVCLHLFCLMLDMLMCFDLRWTKEAVFVKESSEWSLLSNRNVQESLWSQDISSIIKYGSASQFFLDSRCMTFLMVLTTCCLKTHRKVWKLQVPKAGVVCWMPQCWVDAYRFTRFTRSILNHFDPFK